MPAPRRIFKKPTAERLTNAALYYLSRYAASEASLRRVLQNKIRRASMRDPAFAADKEAHNVLFAAIEKIVEGHKKSGVLNDAAYAEMKVGSLRRSGKSARRITQSLAQKGVAPAHIEAALAPEEGEEAETLELKAATALAKKKSLGPFRKGGATDDMKIKTKEVAAMARAGFSFDVIKKILGAGPEDLEDQGFL